MVEFKTLAERTLQLDYGRFVEIAIKQGDRGEFLRIAGGELYLDGNSTGKRYNRGWVSIPLKRHEFTEWIADQVKQMADLYFDGGTKGFQGSAERDRAGKEIVQINQTKPDNPPVEAKLPKGKGRSRAK